VAHVRSLHYAWDFPAHEKAVWRGIELLSQHVKKWRHLCFLLAGFNTTFEEDVYRFERLSKEKIDPYVMVYNPGDLRLKHFARWVNARIYKVCDFDSYEPWTRVRDTYLDGQQTALPLIV
jgi:hypothetical protein